MTIIKDLSEADYNNLLALRASTITLIDQKTLAHAKYAIDNPDSSDSDAFLLGNATHDYFLRNKIFSEKWGIFPEGHNGTTKEGKARKAELTEIYGSNLLKHDQFELIKNLKKSADSQPTISKLFEGISETEITVTWEENGITCKARIDAISEVKGHKILIDLKTTRSANPKDFSNACANYGYLIQSAHYLKGAKANGLIDPDNNDFLHVVIEKEPPYLCAVYCLDDASLELGEEHRAKAMDKYQKALESGLWTGYSEQVETVAAPHWYFQQDNY